MNSGSGRVVLTDQDEAVLQHLARYRLTLTRIAHKEFYSERTEKKAWGRLYTLEKAGYLAKHALPSPGKYWTLGPNGIAHTAATRDWDKPLKAQAFRKWLTTLLFCLDGKTKRTRLTAFEMQQLSEGLYHKQLFEGRNYFLQRDEKFDCIGSIKPAGDKDPYMVARRCRQELSLHAKHPEFAALMSEGRFLIAVVVATKWQVEPIRKAIEKHLADLPDQSQMKPRFKVFLRAGLGKLLPVMRST